MGNKPFLSKLLCSDFFLSISLSFASSFAASISLFASPCAHSWCVIGQSALVISGAIGGCLVEPQAPDDLRETGVSHKKDNQRHEHRMVPINYKKVGTWKSKLKPSLHPKYALFDLGESDTKEIFGMSNL